MNIKVSSGERIFHIVNCIFISLCAFIALYPFIQVIATSFSSSRAVYSGEVVWKPVDFNIMAYRQLLQDGQILMSMKNTVVLTVVGTALNLLFTILAAYSFSKKRLLGRNALLFIVTITMVFSGGMIPNFILIKSLGLMDTSLMNGYLSLWLPGLISTYNMFVMKTYFEGIPESLEEAALIDGAGYGRTLISIVIPISMPILATMTLFYAVGWWNSYFNAMMFINKSSAFPLMVKLMQMLDTAQLNQIASSISGSEAAGQELVAPETFKAASIIVATLPILCVYPFLQKYFVKGVMLGSVKG